MPSSFYEIVEVSDRGRTTWVVEQDGVPVEECPDLPAALRCYRRLRHLNEDQPIIHGERKSRTQQQADAEAYVCEKCGDKGWGNNCQQCGHWHMR